MPALLIEFIPPDHQRIRQMGIEHLGIVLGEEVEVDDLSCDVAPPPKGIGAKGSFKRHSRTLGHASVLTCRGSCSPHDVGASYGETLYSRRFEYGP